MEVSIKKVGVSQGVERFVLVDPESRQVLSSQVDEPAVRRFFESLQVDQSLLESCLSRARDLFDAKSGSVAPGEEPSEEDELLFELGLDDD